MKVVPKLWNGHLAWMLRVEVLEDNVEGTAALVAGAQDGGDGGGQVVMDVGDSDVGKWFK